MFSGSGIWPKYGAGFGKTQNILREEGIWLPPRMRNSSKFWRGMRDCLAVCREFGKSYVVAVNANQPASVQWCLLSKQTIKAFKKSTGWQESALGSSIPLVVQAFYVYCKSYEEIIWSVKFKIWRTVQWFCSPESDSHSFGQSSIFVHASGHRLRLQSFKGPKEGSHDQGWEREWEETLRSPPLSLFASFSPVFPPLHHILV